MNGVSMNNAQESSRAVETCVGTGAASGISGWAYRDMRSEDWEIKHTKGNSLRLKSRREAELAHIASSTKNSQNPMKEGQEK